MKQFQQFDGRILLVLKTALDNYQRYQVTNADLAKPWLFVVETLIGPIEGLDIWAIRQQIYEEDERRSRHSTMKVVNGAEFNRINNLSEREREILRLIGQGQKTETITSLLGIASRTLFTHKMNIVEKLNLGSMKNIPKFAIDNLQQL